MRRDTDFAVYDGDMLSMSSEKSACHICGTGLPPGAVRMCFGSIRNGDKHSGTLSWCEICLPCSKQVIEFFKPRQTANADGAKTLAQHNA